MYYLRTRAAADAIKFTVDQQALARRKAARAANAANPDAEPLKVDPMLHSLKLLTLYTYRVGHHYLCVAQAVAGRHFIGAVCLLIMQCNLFRDKAVTHLILVPGKCKNSDLVRQKPI